MSDWQKDFRELRDVLTAATKVRHLRPGFVDGDLEWVTFERSVMHDATNTIRARYQKPPVSVAEILVAENRACGHIDYVQKYAIGCADLVHAGSADA
jgi:hypothetical protein